MNLGHSLAAAAHRGAFGGPAGLDRILVPTLLGVAADDAVTPRFYSEELASRIPGAKLVVLDGCRHFVPNIFADRYNAAVGGFLRAQIGR